MTTIAALVAARANDDSPAIRDFLGDVSWRDAVTAGTIRAVLARSLHQDQNQDQGQTRPFHIGILLPNVREYLMWLNAIALSGAVAVGINPTRRGELLAADIRTGNCSLLVTDAEGAGLLHGLDFGVKPENVLVIDSDRYANLLTKYASFSTKSQDILSDASKIAKDQLFLLIFTSGTTGSPKAVKCTQGRLASIAEVAAPGYGYTPDDVCYCPMPLFHGNALMALWGPAVFTGSTIALRPRFSASAFLDDVRSFGATKFSYVGKAIAYILATPERPDDSDNTLKIGFGTEASVNDRYRFKKRFGCYLIEGYGQSEGGAVLNPVLGMPKGSLGKPVDGVDLCVLRPETGDECPRAEFDEHGLLINAGEATGEIVNRSGRGGFEGYYGAAELESDRMRNGWYWTGDLGYVDKEGFFYFAGRSGDWLRVDSENFSAGPVEAILSRYSDFAVVAIYPVPDPGAGAGDQVMAAVELQPGCTFDANKFASWMQEQSDLGTKWTPRFIRVSESLPQTGSGKVTKTTIRKEAWVCREPIWWCPDPLKREYRLLTDDDLILLASQMKEQGRVGADAGSGSGSGSGFLTP